MLPEEVRFECSFIIIFFCVCARERGGVWWSSSLSPSDVAAVVTVVVGVVVATVPATGRGTQRRF